MYVINTKTLWLLLHLFTFKHFSRRKSWLHYAMNTKTLWFSLHLFTFKQRFYVYNLQVIFFQLYSSVFICLDQICRSASSLHRRYGCIIITLLWPMLLFITFFLYHLLRFIITIFFSIAQTFLNRSILTIFFSIWQTHLITNTSLHSPKTHLPLQFSTYLIFLILIWAILFDTKALPITQRYACLTFIFLWTTRFYVSSSFIFHHLFCFSNFYASSSSMFHHFLCFIIIIIFFFYHILLFIITHFYNFFKVFC